jgi:hypothetical protein
MGCLPHASTPLPASCERPGHQRPGPGSLGEPGPDRSPGGRGTAAECPAVDDQPAITGRIEDPRVQAAPNPVPKARSFDHDPVTASDILIHAASDVIFTTADPAGLTSAYDAAAVSGSRPWSFGDTLSGAEPVVAAANANCDDLAGGAAEVSRHGKVPRRAFRPPIYDPTSSVGTCPDCGKHMFASRQAAKRAARQAQQDGIVVTRVYRCGKFFHWTSQDTAATTRFREWRAS